jgi:cell division protein FtsZ
MEVDEAANHIRELVDPDANIIWGSAFNDDLQGKIRVSVVATGIDSDASAKPAPVSQPFSFASRPVVVTPVPATPAAAEPAPVVVEAPAAPVAEEPAAAEPAMPAASRPVAVISDFDDPEDELVLGEENAEPAAKADQATPPAPSAPRVAAAGGTLFERMSGLSRGLKANEDDNEERGNLDIPRFLNRQNNQ